ncbi:hypothetical protein EAG_09796 [Camponotus floridanus]|uniref:Uncharacterized protein n=1 Tax=Camponotus floridanus TaxID=104421 RepID=E2AUS5_CAMFO|nr:hypothetical protein EAG_09796 [Camponotus floridanus]
MRYRAYSAAGAAERRAEDGSSDENGTKKKVLVSSASLLPVTTEVKSKLRSKRRWFLLFYLKICDGPFHFSSSCENPVKSVRTGPTFAHYSRSHRSRNHRPISFTGDELKNNSIRADLSFPFAMYTGHDRSSSPGRKALIIISRGEIRYSLFDRVKRVKANATGLATLTSLKRWSRSSQANRRVREPPKTVIMSADCVRSPEWRAGRGKEAMVRKRSLAKGQWWSGVRSVRGLSITVKCAAWDGFMGNSANWIAPYISIQQMKIDSDAVPLITTRRIATELLIHSRALRIPASRPIVHMNIKKERIERDIKPEFERTNRRLRCLAPVERHRQGSKKETASAIFNQNPRGSERGSIHILRVVTNLIRSLV